MKNAITIQTRIFMVTLRDQRTGERFTDLIALDKAQLRAAQMVGQSSKELLYRLFNHQGFKVLEVGSARKTAVTIDLTAAALGEAEV